MQKYHIPQDLKSGQFILFYSNVSFYNATLKDKKNRSILSIRRISSNRYFEGLENFEIEIIRAENAKNFYDICDCPEPQLIQYFIIDCHSDSQEFFMYKVLYDENRMIFNLIEKTILKQTLKYY